MTAPIVSLIPGPSVGEAVEEFLARPQLDRDTARSYRQTLGRLCTELGAARCRWPA
ncbi:hypothetical protein [Nonomuraea sp. NPDC049158]|uniref:hypothetical protein n=1 Tax=Nonomuraea sp. NPDC049158 TaxID=3155649 RepID=UPI0033EEF28B